MALNLFEPMRVAHLTNSHLQWSYYFSGRGDFLVVYPFASGPDFMRALHTPTFDEYLGAMYAYDVYGMELLHGTQSGTATGRRPISTLVGPGGWSAMPPRSMSPMVSRAWWAPTSCSTSSMGRSAGNIDRLAGYGSSTIAAVSWGR